MCLQEIAELKEEDLLSTCSSDTNAAFGDEALSTLSKLSQQARTTLFH